MPQPFRVSIGRPSNLLKLTVIALVVVLVLVKRNSESILCTPEVVKVKAQYDFNPYYYKNDTTQGGGSWWRRPNVVFGHLHMAKTAGTEINGALAMHYERVCGHKGYSFDAYEANKLFDASNATEGHDVDDSIHKHFGKGYSRSVVPFRQMRERGYDDCDLVSLEEDWEAWLPLASHWKMEIHVPCRDPLEMLMSTCNYLKIDFNCRSYDATNATLLEAELEKCMLFMGRYHSTLETHPNITLKCFDPMPPMKYVNFMGAILQQKRVQAEYLHRETNKARNRQKECIWREKPVQDKLLELMKEKYSYVSFCNECMGSQKELPL